MMPSAGLLVKLKLVSPWLFSSGIKTISFFLVREEFQKNIQSAPQSHKAVAYAALRAIGFLLDARKCISERGY